MSILTLKDYIAEARKSDGKYNENKTKGIIDKVILELEGSDAGQATKLARRYKRLQISLKRMEEAKDELNTKLSGMVSGAFDEASDSLVTRVLATASFTVTLAKQQAAKEKSDINYAKIFEGIMTLVDKDLQDKIDELIKANTRTWMADPPKASLTVKQIEEGMVDAAKGALGTLLSKITVFADKLKAKFRVWGRSYDAKLRELKDEANKPHLSESTELYVVIGNPGRSQPSAMWPKTEAPEAMSRLAAEEQAEGLNSGRSKITYGVLPSSVHWHAKPLSKSLDYVIGSAAVNSLKKLIKTHKTAS